MSKIEYPFHIDEEAEFRFALVLESRSVEAHSMMDSDGNKDSLKISLEWILEESEGMKESMKDMIRTWKEKHK